MKAKSYYKLSQTQKVKADEAINKCVKRYFSVIDFNECRADKERCQTILKDSIDIHYYSVSNFLMEFDFKMKVDDLIKSYYNDDRLKWVQIKQKQLNSKH